MVGCVKLLLLQLLLVNTVTAWMNGAVTRQTSRTGLASLMMKGKGAGKGKGKAPKSSKSSCGAAMAVMEKKDAPATPMPKSEEVATPVAPTAEVQTDFALLFDCDGVIVETEELHRLAYNAAFNNFQLKLPDGTPVEWDVKYYDKLQNTVGGGKPKMKHHFNNDVKAWPVFTAPGGSAEEAAPETQEARDALVDALQDSKTEFYKELLGQVAKPRPGVIELLDEAIADPTLKVGICSAATKAGFVKVVDTLVGQDRLAKLDVVKAGDDVSLKKPDPMIYNLARDIVDIPAENCIVIEDSLVGLRAAKAAGMKCIITYTDSTEREDFYGEGADAVIPNLGNVSLKDIFSESLRSGASKEVLPEKRDAPKKKAAKKSKPAAKANADETVSEADAPAATPAKKTKTTKAKSTKKTKESAVEKKVAAPVVEAPEAVAAAAAAAAVEQRLFQPLLSTKSKHRSCNDSRKHVSSIYALIWRNPSCRRRSIQNCFRKVWAVDCK